MNDPQSTTFSAGRQSQSHPPSPAGDPAASRDPLPGAEAIQGVSAPSPDSDVVALLDADWRCLVQLTDVFSKNVANHRTDLSAAMRQRLTDDLVTLEEAVRAFECSRCEDGLALVHRGFEALCPTCDQKIAADDDGDRL